MGSRENVGCGVVGLCWWIDHIGVVVDVYVVGVVVVGVVDVVGLDGSLWGTGLCE